MLLGEMRLDQLKAAELKLLCVERRVLISTREVVIESLQDSMRTDVSRPSGVEVSLPTPLGM